MSPEALQRLWRCNRAIADLNVARLQDMDLRRHLTPAILAYEGLQYRYLAPGVLEAESLAYLQAHLRILSGFYGLLRPFDGVVPYPFGDAGATSSGWEVGSVCLLGHQAGGATGRRDGFCFKSGLKGI